MFIFNFEENNHMKSDVPSIGIVLKIMKYLHLLQVTVPTLRT